MKQSGVYEGKGCSDDRNQTVNNKADKGIKFFELLLKLSDSYINAFNWIGEGRGKEEVRTLKEERLVRIQKINDFIKEIELHVHLQQNDKLDCLFESLQIVIKMSVISSRNDIETRSRRLSEAVEQKAIQQVQMNVVQNMAELMLSKMMPQRRDYNSIHSTINIIISQLYEDSTNTLDYYKQKTKPHNKKTPKEKPIVLYSLANGNHIQLVWFLIFRIVQKNLEDVFQIHRRQLNQNGDLTLGQSFEKHICKYIKDIVNKIVIHQFNQGYLFRDLLKATVRHVNQFELPVIPFFLKQLHLTTEEMFKENFQNGKGHKIDSKETFSFENIALYLELSQHIANQTVFYQTSKMMATVTGICSYCGVRKNSSFERLIYQKVCIRMNQSQDLTICICESCCKHLQLEPGDSASLMILAPLILSRFWKVSFPQNRMVKAREALTATLTWQTLNNKNKQLGNKKYKQPKVYIARNIAMNNEQESVNNQLIQQLYNTFLFDHANLSIKQILFSAIQISMIFNSSKDEKTRQRSIKMLDKQYIRKYLFHTQGEPRRLGTKVLEIYQNRLKDKCSEVSLAALQSLASLTTSTDIPPDLKVNYLQSILGIIIDRSEYTYSLKALSQIQKMLNKCNRLDPLNQQKSYFLRLVFFLKILNCLVALTDKFLLEVTSQTQTLNTQVSKLMHTVIKLIRTECSKAYIPNQERALFEVDSFCRSISSDLITVLNLDSATQKIMLCLLSSIVFNKNLLVSMSEITSSVVQELIILTDWPECGQETSLKIQKNMGLLLDVGYQEIFAMKGELMMNKKREPLRNKSYITKLQGLTEYISSLGFIQVLTSIRKNQDRLDSPSFVQIPNKCKLWLLSRLLYANNIHSIISSQQDVQKYLEFWVNNNKKESDCPISPIFLSSQMYQLLQRLSSQLQESVKSSKPQDLQIEASLLVHINVFLGKTDTFRNQTLLVYERYCSIFRQKYAIEQQRYKKRDQTLSLSDLLRSFLTLNRCLYIGTILVIEHENYLLLKRKVQLFYENQISSLVDGNVSSVHRMKRNEEVLQTSWLFNKLYVQIVAILQYSEPVANEDPEICVCYNKFLQLLKFYWQVHPNILFSQSKLIRILQLIREKTPQGFTMIKSLYQLFASLFPSNNIQLLNFIREQFTKRVYILISNKIGKQDEEFMESCFCIIYNLLKTGIEGLYVYSKYLFYGLLYENSTINQITIKIIQQIYTKEASEKIIFVNLMQSLELIHNTIFEFSEKKPLEEIQLSQQQKKSLSILSELTFQPGSVFLVKDKKTMKMKTTFVKKIGDMLGGDLKMLKTKPTLLMMIMKMLKCQRRLDYCELNEIIFCLHRIVRTNQLYIEELLQVLKFDTQLCQNQDSSLHEIRIVMAFRETVSCLAYFSKYKESAGQIKYYNHSFSSNLFPYTELQELIALNLINPKDSDQTKLDKVENDINTFLEIVLEGVQCMPNTTQQHNTQQTISSNQTTLSEVRRSKRNKNKVTQNETDKQVQKKYKKQSKSVDYVCQRSKLTDDSSETNPPVKDSGYRTRLRNKPKQKVNTLKINTFWK